MKGKPGYWKGKKIGEAARLKMSEAAKNRPPIKKETTIKRLNTLKERGFDMSGKNNPMSRENKAKRLLAHERDERDQDNKKNGADNDPVPFT